MLSSFQHSDHCLSYLTETIAMLPGVQGLGRGRRYLHSGIKTMVEFRLGRRIALAENASAVVLLPYSACWMGIHNGLKMGNRLNLSDEWSGNLCAASQGLTRHGLIARKVKR